MANIAVLGAGYMGSAITIPLCENGHDVRLWGTWLDDELISETRKGKHPRLGRALHTKLQLYDSTGLGHALEDRDVIIIAVTSEGFIPVLRKLLQALTRPLPLVTLTKGFVTLGDEVLRVSEGAARLYNERFARQEMQWASVGGPVKAVELSRGIPTATVFGYRGSDVASLFPAFPTPYYRVLVTGDVTGVELCSALKNVYAMGMGMCDGMHEKSGVEIFHNFKAFVFNQAVREMAMLVERAGGSRETVFDLAGVGDLYVTSASGRNGIFGRKVGAGGVPAEEYRRMLEAGEVAEGYHTLKLLMTYADTLERGVMEKLPLLRAIEEAVFGGKNPRDELLRFTGQCYGTM
jgi:glycerol-3-phosphate dehydrogenase (NAD(P)+)